MLDSRQRGVRSVQAQAITQTPPISAPAPPLALTRQAVIVWIAGMALGWAVTTLGGLPTWSIGDTRLIDPATAANSQLLLIPGVAWALLGGALVGLGPAWVFASPGRRWDVRWIAVMAVAWAAVWAVGLLPFFGRYDRNIISTPS